MNSEEWPYLYWRNRIRVAGEQIREHARGAAETLGLPLATFLELAKAAPLPRLRKKLPQDLAERVGRAGLSAVLPRIAFYEEHAAVLAPEGGGDAILLYVRPGGVEFDNPAPPKIRPLPVRRPYQVLVERTEEDKKRVLEAGRTLVDALAEIVREMLPDPYRVVEE